MNKNIRPIITIFSLFFIISLLSFLGNLYVEYQWFKAEGYQSVFKTIFLSKWGIRLAVGFLTFAFIFTNLIVTRKILANAQFFRKDDNIIHLYNKPDLSFLTPKFLTVVFTVLSLSIAFFVSQVASGNWETVLKFFNSTPFSLKDPVFSHDVGFYIFKLPLYWLIHDLFLAVLVITVFILGIVYFLANPRELLDKNVIGRGKAHLLSLISIILILRAISYFLNRYDLLFSTQGVAFGAGYTDIHAKLLALNVLPFVSIVSAFIILMAIYRLRFKLVIFSFGLLIGAAIILNGIFPALVQKFSVDPDELTKEKPYLKNNIEFTRIAYGLDRIKKEPFPVNGELDLGDLEANSETITNIRLWDWQPLKQTFSQLQEMRIYYQFNDVDIDRYTVNGEYRQVMLSPRELTSKQLPETAKSWINEKLIYTHGYGLAMTPVNEVTNEGLPNFFIKDIPPQSTTDISIKRPEIYFGEITDDYVVVNTQKKEFDYPKGDENVYSSYQGKGGIKLDSFWKRMVLAFYFKEFKLILNNDITPESRILFNRNVAERVAKTTPFVKLDRDPYMTIIDDKLLWIIDGYTTSSNFPYAEPTPGIGNYIRNSVKIVVDAYDGKMKYYISEPSDPIIKTYTKIFPDLFANSEEMPDEIKEHIRYPVELFNIQSEIYSTYHMEDPQIFYTREDRWSIPEEMFGDKKQTMEPYYVIMKLPGEDKSEFILMRPFTAATKPNMVAWMAARSDGEHYGTVLVYQFPKQKLIYGPMQIESRINQDSEISQQLNLWDQRGSQVIRGNLLVIPMSDALLYVEPLYLQAQQSKLPELRRVIVSYKENVVMETNLRLALEKIFGKSEDNSINQQPSGDNIGTEEDLQALIFKANKLFEDAQNRIQTGDWAGYGQLIEELEESLKKMQSLNE